MSLTVTHSRVQHGVGQGSFHSATVETQSRGQAHRFDYVYDCGALKFARRPPELERAIDRMDVDRRLGMGSKGFVDMLVLSHYDQDHMNGAELLTARFRVGRIVVPFISPEELMLVLASQAASIAPAVVTALHQLANGSQTLFGVQVTMVQPGARDAGVAGGDDGGGNDPDEPPDGGRREVEWPPRPMVVTRGPNRQPLGATLLDHENVQLGVNGDWLQPFWKLRFWNRGVAEDLLVYLFDELVACDFPLHALDDHNAGSELARWLDVKANRDATAQAYERAIASYAPAWASEAAGKKLANFLSLGMFSGPMGAQQGSQVTVEATALLPSADGYPQAAHCLCEEYCYWRPERVELVGWLGTGDAPLGETSVWGDFGAHYAAELPHTGTALVPHHGAAPLGGPRFYNPRLHPRRGMLAVISVGKTNTFGHPRAAVLKQAMAVRANIQLVTEDTAMGLHEVFVLEA